jgi:hypothetical protein
MGARTKLNRAFVNGALLIAAVCGFVSQSWTAFLITVAVLLLLSVGSGEIRLANHKRR